MQARLSVIVTFLFATSCLLIAPAGPTAAAVGEVLSNLRITEGENGFVGPLDAFSADFGIAVAAIGDVDDDGVMDIAVGDRDGFYDVGAVWILFLNSNGTVKSEQKIASGVGGFTGVLDNSDYFGASIAALGDISGDGIEDIAVGATGDDDGGFGRGAVWVLALDTDGTVKAHQKISDTEGDLGPVLADLDGFGTDVVALGDVDGDGIGDLAVGVAGDDDGLLDNNGAIWILFLDANSTVKSKQKISALAGNFTGNPTGNLGASLAFLGDLDGDGIQDIASSGRAGAENSYLVWILFLDSDGTVKSHQTISETEGNFTGSLDDLTTFGASIATIGDVDCDGVVDIAVGDDFDGDRDPDPITAEGAMWILLLNTDGTVKAHQKINKNEGGFTGTLEWNARLGAAATGLGDLDGDGTPDLAVGAPIAGKGVVWMLFLDGGCTVPATVQGFDAGWAGDHVEVSWRLIDVGGELSFEVFRREETGGPFAVVRGAVARNDNAFTFEDYTAGPGERYRYRVVIEEDGTAVTSFETTVTTPELPFTLGHSEPNPFNPSTRIPFSLESDAHITLAVYDVSGKRVVTLVDGPRTAGAHAAVWDGRNASGRPAATGIYFYRLTAGHHTLTRKAVLLK